MQGNWQRGCSNEVFWFTFISYPSADRLQCERVDLRSGPGLMDRQHVMNGYEIPTLVLGCCEDFSS